jgi:hypothetical protein
MKVLSRWVCGLVVLMAGCTSSTDQPGSTPLPRPDTPPTRLLSFSGTLQPQGVNSHPFSVTQAGEVQITLLGVGLVGVEQPQPITVGLGIGTAGAGGECLVTHSVNTQGGTRAQITGTGLEGALCACIFDVGTLTAPAIYTITVASP